MIRLVFLADSCFEDAVSSPERGSLLVSMLHSLLENCLLLDFNDYRLETSVQKLIPGLEPTTKREVEAVLSEFSKRNRILRWAEPDWAMTQTDLELIAKQANSLGLNLVIMRELSEWRLPEPSASTIVLYPIGAFERERRELVQGRLLSDGEMQGADFIQRYLLPLLRYSEEIHIVDGQMGRSIRDDYIRTCTDILHTIRLNTSQLRSITFHLEAPDKDTKKHFINRTLTEAAKKAKLSVPVEIFFYADLKRSKGLLHERFLGTELGLVVIGRGFDFIEDSSGSIRNTSVLYVRTPANETLRLYHANRLT